MLLQLKRTRKIPRNISYIKKIVCSKAPKHIGHKNIVRSKAPEHIGHKKKRKKEKKKKEEEMVMSKEHCHHPCPPQEDPRQKPRKPEPFKPPRSPLSPYPQIGRAHV